MEEKGHIPTLKNSSRWHETKTLRISRRLALVFDLYLSIKQLTKKHSFLTHPLVFGPNPQNLINADEGDRNSEPDGIGKQSEAPAHPNAHSTTNHVDRFPNDEIYHPPKYWHDFQGQVTVAARALC